MLACLRLIAACFKIAKDTSSRHTHLLHTDSYTWSSCYRLRTGVLYVHCQAWFVYWFCTGVQQIDVEVVEDFQRKAYSV